MPRIVFFLSLLFHGFQTNGNELVLTNDFGIVSCDTTSLQLALQKKGAPPIIVSTRQEGLGQVRTIEKTATGSIWEYPERGVRVNLRFEGEVISLHILSDRVGKFTFPVVSETRSMKGWILPLFEGVYVSIENADWRAFLIEGGVMNTTADLTMPFVGFHIGQQTVSCILTNPFNNSLLFWTNEAGLEARLTHEFTRNNEVKEYGIEFRIGSNSPTEPARHYREWLTRRGEFVSFRDKVEKTPDAAKLLGAPHVYVWGDESIAAKDVLDWKAFAKKLHDARQEVAPSPIQRISSLLPLESWEGISNILRSDWIDKYSKGLVLTGFNNLLLRTDLYDARAWEGIAVDAEMSASLKKEPSSLSPAELTRLNCALLFSAFPRLLASPESWGSGVSPTMMNQFADAGFDRLWIGAGSWQGFVRRPETIAAAKRLGFLIGPYDSYHSIHRPNEADTWETAQFGAEAYEMGAIVNADGTRRHGFKKKGYLFSPLAARPYVEKRVNGLMEQFSANSWFIDCDGFGEYFDDYSPAHPARQVDDMQARIARIAWIRDRFKTVVGTEGCFAGVASTVHFAHGVMTPVIGWGDPDLHKKGGKFYLGAYYPPDEPAVFFKQTAIKDEYRRLFYDPACRLPLFQTVFHDSVIATHHWSNPSIKFPEAIGEMELLELLYNVPPLYHLNIMEFGKRREGMKRHYDFFSPLHRELALLPMTDFRWLNPERTVQRTTFGGRVEITANFTGNSFESSSGSFPPNSVVAVWLKEGKRSVYETPGK